MAKDTVHRCPRCHAHLKLANGQLHHIPIRQSFKARNAAIIKMRKKGRSYAEIAAAFGISRQRARQIVTQHEYQEWRASQRLT